MRHILLFLLVLFATVSSPAQQYKYLVLKGGGIRGIAYAGALQVLEDKGVAQGIEKVAGTSVGAITGVLFSMGYTAKEIAGIMYDQDIAAFNDGEGYFIGGEKRLRKRYGWYKGNELEAWVGDMIKEKTGNENTTFGQLHLLAQKDKRYKDLYVTATNLTKQTLEIFSWQTHPDMPVKIAVRASAAIPLYFAAVCIDSTGTIVEKPKEGGHYNIYVDGGLLANYPITLFNNAQDNASNTINEHTLGLKLDRPEQIAYAKDHTGIAPYDIHSFGSYLGALYNMTIEQLNKNVPYTEEQKHTIYISTSNMSPRVRHISREQKKVLFDNGADAARHFFEGTK